MVDKGIFGPDDRLELLDGYLIVREPQREPHAVATDLVVEALRAAFGFGWYVRSQKPVALDDASEPEPDVIVVRGVPRDYLGQHPSRPVLVVEVGQASLRRDRGIKAGLYARAGIAEYWIVNLVRRVLEVSRDPLEVPASRYGWKYGTVRVLAPPATVSPLGATHARVRVADLLP